MTGLRAAALALLVTLGTLGGVALGATQQGPSMSVQTVENTSNYLGPNATDVERTGAATTSLDVAATVSANAGEVRSTFARASLERTYEEAGSPEARRAVVRDGTERLAGRVDALERKEVTAIQRYAAGETDEADLFRTLASIDAEAGERAAIATWLESRAVELDMGAESRRLATLRIRLEGLRGPLRDDIDEGLEGEGSSRVHVETAGGGLVLATTVRDDAGNYVYAREAYSPAIRSIRDTDRYEGSFLAVFERLREIYPWVNEGSPGVGSPTRIGSGGARLYSIVYTHEHGELRPYLDGGTGRVVKETQRLRVDRVPTATRNVTSEAGDLRVRIETTYASGPLGVAAVDAATGDPVNATVLVDGEPVGATRGATVWAVAPRGQANVTVRAGGDRVTATVDAP